MQDRLPGRRFDVERGASSGVVDDEGAIPLVGRLLELPDRPIDKPEESHDRRGELRDAYVRYACRVGEIVDHLMLGAWRIRGHMPGATPGTLARSDFDEPLYAEVWVEGIPMFMGNRSKALALASWQ